MSDKKTSSKQEDSCWFCGLSAPQGLVFDMKFDTFVHLSCLNEAVKDPNNEEAQIMSYLLDSVDDQDYDA